MAYYAPFYQPAYYNPVPARQDIQYNMQYQQPTGQQMGQPAPQLQTSQQTGSGLIWVQGEAGAKSFLVAPGNTVMLMDSEGERFYIKSADASGMPMPLRIFDYKERKEAALQSSAAPTMNEKFNLDSFITRDEFEARMASMASQCQCKNAIRNEDGVNDGKPSV